MTAPRNAEVAALAADDRLEDAAALAEQLGDHGDAAALWERACRYDRAAVAALAAGDATRALLCAARASDPALLERAIVPLAADPGAAARAAEDVVAAGHPVAAGKLRLAAGDAGGGARDLEQGQAWLDAARAYQRADDVRSAARCLESAIAQGVSPGVARLSLGKLLAGSGRDDAASRVLQQIAPDAPERPGALALLRAIFTRRGLDGAVGEIEREMTTHGLPLDAPASAPPAAPDRQPSPAVAAATERLFGRYDVARQIAVTPTARVYEAVDVVSGRRVAVKVFAAAGLRDAGRDALLRFEREAQALGQLRHPSIVPLEAWIPEGPAVVLGWMAGGSMAELLARGPIAPARAAEITGAVLVALGEAHRRGILHRDIKPANVLFDEAGGAHLADFGTAHVSDLAATVTTGIIGTLAYMAPEQRAGEAATIQSDVYGAGALFWHALTGAPPGADLPFLSPELDESARAVARRLVGSVEERPEDAGSARALLASVAWPLTVPEARAAKLPSQRPPAPRSPRLEALDGPRYRDTLLEREILVLGADPPTLERVLPFARADHPALAAVLAHHADVATLWIDAAAGATLEGPLDDAGRALLRAALGALHRAGGVHGCVCPAHVAIRGGQPVLRFALEPRASSADDDLAALAAL